jgi:hypothetical protein
MPPRVPGVGGIGSRRNPACHILGLKYLRARNHFYALGIALVRKRERSTRQRRSVDVFLPFSVRLPNWSEASLPKRRLRACATRAKGKTAGKTQTSLGRG